MGTQEAINNIIRLVGGQDNINNVWHCMTRLRFDLVDDNKVDQAPSRHCQAFWARNCKATSSRLLSGRRSIAGMSKC
jgi:glucose-like phosphotransferase system IIB component